MSPIVPANDAIWAIAFTKTVKAGGGALFIELQGNDGNNVSRARGLGQISLGRPGLLSWYEEVLFHSAPCAVNYLEIMAFNKIFPLTIL